MQMHRGERCESTVTEALSIDSLAKPRFYRLSNNHWRHNMLETIALVLIILWILGLVSSTTMGGFIHLLLVIAIIVILVRVIQGRG